MSATTIPMMPQVTSLDGTELMEVVQPGNSTGQSRRAPVQQIAKVGNLSPGTYTNCTVVVNSAGIIISITSGTPISIISPLVTLGANITAGDLMTVDSSGHGIPSDCATGALPDGFGLVTAPSGTTGYTLNSLSGLQITGLSGLVTGNYYYLGTGGTTHTISATPPATPGYWVQIVGKALSATVLLFDPQEATQL